jgi:hypothetical protein
MVNQSQFYRITRLWSQWNATRKSKSWMKLKVKFKDFGFCGFCVPVFKQQILPIFTGLDYQIYYTYVYPVLLIMSDYSYIHVTLQTQMSNWLKIISTILDIENVLLKSTTDSCVFLLIE